MDLDQMILVSIDDHIIEPPNVREPHARRNTAAGPQFERLPNGVDQWVFQGAIMGPSGLGAVASWPKDEWDFDPVGHAEMRPGCYDVHERVRDMNVNGLLASMNFPTSAGFAGRGWPINLDHELSAIAVAAYNDWHIDELAGSYPGRFMPMGILPLLDIAVVVAEIHRIAAKGCTPSASRRRRTSTACPVRRPLGSGGEGLCDTDIAICMHIGGAFNLLQRPEAGNGDS